MLTMQLNKRVKNGKEQNILTAFIGESQARNKYTYFSEIAKDEGYVQISAVFEETANHEKAHAKTLFKLLEGGEVQIQAAFPAGVLGNTLENLKSATGGENHEWAEMYPTFAKVAREEGFDKIASIFEAIGVAEKQHEKRFLGFIKNMEAGTVFKKDKETKWMCRNCGYVHTDHEAPEVCPACAHPRAHFEVLCENW